MSWEKFNYICRRANAVQQDHEPIAECIKRVEAEPGTQLYGEAIKKNSLSRTLLNEMAQSKDPENARSALGLYASFNLGQWMAKPQQFKRYISYIIYVGLIFFCVSFIYKFYIQPSFIDLMNSLANQSAIGVPFYQQNWLAIQIGTGLILVITCLLSLTYGNLFFLKSLTGANKFVSYLMTPSLKKSYKNLTDLLAYPILKNIKNQNTGTYIQHLQEIDSSGMNVGIEIQALVKAEAERFVRLAERHMKVALAFAWLTLIGGVFLFMVNTYSPIFLLGEAL